MSERIGGYNKRIGALLDKTRENLLEPGLITCSEDLDLQAKCACCLPDLPDLRLGVRIVGVHEHSDGLGLGYQLAQQP